LQKAEISSARDDRAATDVPKNLDANGKSHEYGGYGLENPNATYSYNQERLDETSGTLPNPPTVTVPAWQHHSHTDDPRYDGEHFSTEDTDGSKLVGVPSILSTPSGATLKYDPKTDAVTPISTSPAPSPPQPK